MSSWTGAQPVYEPAPFSAPVKWGVLLARDAFDWLAVLILLIIALSIDEGEPHRTYMHAEDVWQWSYPVLPNTVCVAFFSCTDAPSRNSQRVLSPSWVVIPICFVLPVAVFAGLHGVRRLDRPALTKLSLGVFVSGALTFVTTNAVKLLVGRLRPSFATRCWPNGLVNGLPGVPSCPGDAAAVRQGRKSFPSGHTSMTTSGCAFLSFALLGQARLASPGALWRLVAALAPLALALWVGITRVTDLWHWCGFCACRRCEHFSFTCSCGHMHRRPGDVAAGGALGAAFAWASYSRLVAPHLGSGNGNGNGGGGGAQLQGQGQGLGTGQGQGQGMGQGQGAMPSRPSEQSLLRAASSEAASV